jgi:TRAP-type mannitol/chloroaromatic compound transport system permease large subunit
MFGAGAFVSIYSSGGGLYFFQSLLTGLDLNPWVLFIGMQLFVLLLGMFLDPMGIILLCLPIFFPIVQGMGFDPIWFAILFNINLCIGYITPPFGYNLFYLKSLSPETSMKTIYTSALPFILIMLTCEALMLIFPEIILFLPRIMVF